MKRLADFAIDCVILLAVFALFGFLSKGCGTAYENTEATYTDTIYKTVFDTLKYAVPTPRDSVVLRYHKVKVTVYDTIHPDSLPKESGGLVTINDSGEVQIPIIQKEYGDSTYHAWVSGYMPSLDSINIFNKVQTITKIKKEKPKRWGVGVQGGIEYRKDGFEPYIGIGIHYNIFSW